MPCPASHKTEDCVLSSSESLRLPRLCSVPTAAAVGTKTPGAYGPAVAWRGKWYHAMPSGHYRSARRRMLHRDVWEAHHPDDPPLTRLELVHHINEDPGDNRISNLAVMSPKEHVAEHPRTGAVAATFEQRSAYMKASWAKRVPREFTCIICQIKFMSIGTYQARYCSTRCRGKGRSPRPPGYRKKALTNAVSVSPR